MLRALLLIVVLPLANCACSPAENKCGELCCCVTCTCLEDPYRCEDMWGKPTDPVGTLADERWSDPAWLENHHREQMAIAEEHRRQHQERMREMEANMPQEQRERRERMARRRMERRRKPRGEGVEDDEDDEENMLMAPDDLEDTMGRPGAGDADKMRRRMEKRMQASMKKHRRHTHEEPDGEEPPEEGGMAQGRFKKGWEWEEESRDRDL